MKIFVIHHPEDAYASEIVTTAMIRSFSASQVSGCLYQHLDTMPAGAVLINPGENQKELLGTLMSGRRKILILGTLHKSISEDIGLTCYPLPAASKEWEEILVDEKASYSNTSVAIFYNQEHPLAVYSVFSPRYLQRYDFASEWNNLGYGCISTLPGIWSICSMADTNGATPIAELRNSNNSYLTLYSSICDMPSASVLWYNRQVGPVDSLEWCMIEKFFSEYRSDKLVCFPYISEIPSGFDGAVSMRLDCDTTVSSAKQLFELYANLKLPFTMAVTTGMKLKARARRLLKDVIQSQGAIVSHSHSHFPDWGGNYKTAFCEAFASQKILEDIIPESKPVKYAVSPFHQNPIFAVKALAAAGYEGFIGGIIKNDPEFLMGRAGRVPFVEAAMVSHSQQCMLSGSCGLHERKSIDIYKKSFLNHLKTKSIFGYFDHSISKNYNYGWSSEKERLKAHFDLVNFIQGKPDIWWCNTNECLDFLKRRDLTQVFIDDKGKPVTEYPKNFWPPISIIWKGEKITS